MKKLFFGLLLISSLPLVAQKSETRKIGAFKGVKVSQAIDLYLKKADKESAKVMITGGDLEDVITEVDGTTLRVKMRDTRGFFSKVDVKVYVTYVNLEKISASSASSVFSEGIIKANNMDVGVSSAANVEIAVDAASMMVDVSRVSSGGEVDAYKLESETVKASASSGGDAKISVSKDLEAHASSGADIRYRGNPSRTNTHSSSGGSVKKSN